MVILYNVGTGGWAYLSQLPADGVFILDGTYKINGIEIHSMYVDRKHKINDFSIFYSTSAFPSIKGADWTPITGGLAFFDAGGGSSVSGGTISGNTVRLDGEDFLRLSFDTVEAYAVRIQVHNSNAPNRNGVLTEIVVHGSKVPTVPSTCTRYANLGCAGRNELFIGNKHTRASCEAKAHTYGNMVSYEYHTSAHASYGRCQISSSCTLMQSRGYPNLDLHMCV
jgi:hypothetical protein